MSPALPLGSPVPTDGALPPLVGGTSDRAFGVYVHVPFCRVRCGYCDFNTYTSTELGGGADASAYASTALREVTLARGAMDAAGVAPRPVSTVFFGGGTPTMLPAADLAAILSGVRETWGLVGGAEVTTEANPDSVDERYLATLAEAGFTRVSFGMQSAVPHVLATLERTHDPARVPDVVRWARAAGLDVSLDLIYGTPGESLDDWRTSVEQALATGVDHVSAYALVVEPGTKMAAQVRRGELTMPSGDDEADKYELADELFEQAGLRWYEVSNWAREVDGAPAACRHNLAYWRGDDWWGIGPGAHSYLGPGSDVDREDGPEATGALAGVRWWNVKHPRAYAAALERGETPAAGRELLTREQAELEHVLLGVRLAEGYLVSHLPPAARGRVAGLIARGLVDGRAAVGGRLVLTRRGRLLADGIVDELTD